MLIIVGVLLLRGGSTRPARVVETSIALLDSDECGVVGVREVVYAVWMATPRAEGAHADAVEVVQLGVRGSEIGSNKPSMFQRPITCGSVAEDIQPWSEKGELKAIITENSYHTADQWRCRPSREASGS